MTDPGGESTQAAHGRSRRRLVAVTQTFNEAAFIGRWLDRTALCADEVIVIDDGSTDETLDIVRAHPAVTEVIVKKRGKRTEVKDLQRLFDAAMDHGADWILRLDADETFDNRIHDRLDELLAADGVSQYLFRKYWLWRGEHQYRADRPEKFAQWNPDRLVRAVPGLRWRYPDGATWKRLAKVAIGHTRWKPQYGNRGLTGERGRPVQVEGVVIVHYAAVDFTRMQWKHIRYAIGEREEHPRRDADEIADWATKGLDESTLRLEPVPEEWKPLV